MNALACTQTALFDISTTMLESAPGTLDQYDLQVWHNHYDCPLHTWLSQTRVNMGKTTVDRYILYVEYRDRYRASQYKEFNFDSLEEGLSFRNVQVVDIELKGINPEMTRRHPIKSLSE